MTTKQESLLGEKEKALEALRQEVESLKHSLSLKEEEVRWSAVNPSEGGHATIMYDCAKKSKFAVLETK